MQSASKTKVYWVLLCLQWKGLVEVGILESILQLQSEIKGSL